MSGYRSYRTKDVVKDGDVAEGAEPFRATIITSLSFAEIAAIKIGASTTYNELFATIAPYIVAWNAEGRITGTDEYERLPPPAEAGPAILQKIDPNISLWLTGKLCTVHAGGDDLPKGRTPSEPTPGGQNEPDSSSPMPETSQTNHLDLIG